MKISLVNLFLFILLVSCNQPVARKPVTKKTSSFLEESVSINKSLINSEEKIFKIIMAKDSLATYYTSPNGFWYTFNKKSTHSYFPQYSDQVIYSYDVFDVEGNQIYSKDELGVNTYYIDQQNIVEGLRNGFKLMNEGDIVTFLFPSHKVFGYLGDENKIKVNQPLIYKVQLNKINRKNESN